jgi:hypothetical protein
MERARARVTPLVLKAQASVGITPVVTTARIRPNPTEDRDLKKTLLTRFGVVLPDTKVCPNHTTPFRAFADAYFARSTVSVWKASRGFGGKSYLLSLLGHCEADMLNADVTILGGSGEQSSRVLEYLQGWAGDEQNTKRRTLYGGGGRVTALMASTKSARGPHPQRMRLDEVDEIDLAILDAAMGQPMLGRGIQKQTVMSSTHQYADGTMTEVLKRAAERGWPVYEWCWKESSASPHGWLTGAEIESKRGEVTSAMWAAEYDLQEPSPEDRAILSEKVALCFRKELGEHDGALGKEVIIEEPIDGAKYSHGADWARKKDYTVIDTWRIDVRPMRRVAWVRLGRQPWPEMIAKFDARVEKYKGQACHDATGIGDVVAGFLSVDAEAVILTGQDRADIFTQYIAAIENGSIESPYIKYCEGEHKYCTNDDLRGAGHPPDSVVAGALAYRASQKKPKSFGVVNLDD